MLKGASDPDHTILVTLNSFFTTPLRQQGLGVDIQTFTPVRSWAWTRSCCGCTRIQGITTFEEWLEAVKAANGEYVMGGTGKGQEDSIVIAWLSELRARHQVHPLQGRRRRGQGSRRQADHGDRQQPGRSQGLLRMATSCR
jgi:tripartite-type tricarboxylate transporter receptor subunit TctC